MVDFVKSLLQVINGTQIGSITSNVIL